MTEIGKEEELFCRMPKSEDQIFHFGEVMGLASGAKKAAFLEIMRRGELESFMDQLSHFAPERSFHLMDASGNDWQTKAIGEFDRNVIVSEDLERISRIKDLFEFSKGKFPHAELGELLSYPECCLKGRNRSSSGNALSGSTINSIDFRMNNFLIRTTPNLMIVRHYLCGYDCEASIEYASKVIDFLKYFPKTLEFVEKVLQMPIMIIPPEGNEGHLVRNGIPFLFEGSYEDETTLRYNKVYPLSKPLTPSPEMKIKADSALKAIVSGDGTRIREGGMDVLSGSKVKSSINGDFIFIWPKKNPQTKLGDQSPILL